MIESQNVAEVEAGSERGFGIVFAVVFGLVGIWPVLFGNPLRIWAVVVAVAFLVLAFTFPRILKYPNLLWHKLGMLLGAIIAPIVMAFVYFLTIVPTGLYARLTGKDLLGRTMKRDAKTYWIDRENPAGSMKNQY